MYCVEQGRWAGRSKEFEAKGSFAAPGLRSRLMEKTDQARVWAEVDRYARAAAAPSPSRDYQAVYEQPEVKAHVEGVTRDLGEPPGAAALGAAVFVGRTLAGLDLFGDPPLFARQWPKLLRAQSLDAYRRPAEPDDKGLRGRVEELVRIAALAPGTARMNPAGVGQLFESRVEGHRAAALVHAGRGVVHVAILDLRHGRCPPPRGGGTPEDGLGSRRRAGRSRQETRHSLGVTRRGISRGRPSLFAS